MSRLRESFGRTPNENRVTVSRTARRDCYGSVFAASRIRGPALALRRLPLVCSRSRPSNRAYYRGQKLFLLRLTHLSPGSSSLRLGSSDGHCFLSSPDQPAIAGVLLVPAKPGTQRILMAKCQKPAWEKKHSTSIAYEGQGIGAETKYPLSIMLCAGLGDVLLCPGCIRDRNIAFAGFPPKVADGKPGAATRAGDQRRQAFSLQTFRAGFCLFDAWARELRCESGRDPFPTMRDDKK